MNSPWDLVSLPEVFGYIRDSLARATRDEPHPWRTPVLATTGAGGPNARTVVLRGLTLPGFELLAYSDTRAAKVAELRAEPEAVWLFYDPHEQVQLRAVSTVRLHTGDAVAQTYWHRLPDEHRFRYQADAAPGMVIARPARGQTLAAGDEGNFTVMIGTVRRLDWLWLGSEGHRRAIFRREGDDWPGQWVAP